MGMIANAHMIIVEFPTLSSRWICGSRTLGSCANPVVTGSLDSQHTLHHPSFLKNFFLKKEDGGGKGIAVFYALCAFRNRDRLCQGRKMAPTIN